MLRLFARFAPMVTFLMSPCFAFAATHVAAGSSAAQMQAAINACSTGDTAQMPSSPSSVTWNGGLVTVTTSIVVDLNGWTINRGTGTGDLIAVTTNATGPVRITNGTLAQTVTGAFVLTIFGPETNQIYRADHLTMTSTASGSFLVNLGVNFGLIDHCSLNAPGSSEMIHNFGYGDGVTTGWTEVIVPGSSSAAYIEDCTFTNTDTGANYFGNSSIQGYNGCRTVMRHNSHAYSQIDMHGGNVSARWWEIWDETFTGPNGGNQSQLAAIRGGSGVIFRLHVVPFSNVGAGNIAFGPQTMFDVNTYQVGRGIISGGTPTAYPAYNANNDAAIPISFTSPVVDGTDVIETIRPSYTPFQYPYLGSYPVSATINAAGTTLTIVWPATMTDGAGGRNGFSWTPSGGASSITYSSGTGTTTYVYSLGRTILTGETFASGLAYAQPTSGMQVPASGVVQTLTDVGSFPQASGTSTFFTGAAVTNNSTQTGGGGTANASLAGNVALKGNITLQ